MEKENHDSDQNTKHILSHRWMNYYSLLFIGINIVITFCNEEIKESLNKNWDVVFVAIGIIVIAIAPVNLYETKKTNLSNLRMISMVISFIFATGILVISWTMIMRIVVVSIEILMLGCGYLVCKRIENSKDSSF